MNIMENTAFPHDLQLRNVTSINPSSHFLIIYKRKVHELSVFMGACGFYRHKKKVSGRVWGGGDEVTVCHSVALTQDKVLDG